MNGLHNLITQGKVLYLGVSDTPAWIVSKANTYARMAGKTPFIIYQGAWSILDRAFEREVLPMAISEGEQCCGLSSISPLSAAIRHGCCTLVRCGRRQNSHRCRGRKASSVR